jgi:predicted dehydrogenase
MVSAQPIGVGIVGLSAGDCWATRAHLSALAAVDGFELRGLATSTPESARAAARTHGVALAVSDVAELAADDVIDLVVVAVKVPEHRGLVLPALHAGKDVLCEWPLARDLAEAEELEHAADVAGVRTFVGLQGRAAPTTRYLQDLVADGYVGAVLSTSMIASTTFWGPEVDARAEILLDPANGATMQSIPFGHTIDVLTMVLGEFEKLSATTATRRPWVRNVEMGGMVASNSADQIAVCGTLEGGAVASIHFRGGMSRATNMLWEINGTEGDLLISADAGYLQHGFCTLSGGRGDDRDMRKLAVPPRYDRVPQLAGQLGHTVAHLYLDILSDLRTGARTAPDFAAAVGRHRMLEQVR